MKIEASAPSNIALIKYMGKTGLGNRPTNASLSYTLEHLRSFVVIEPSNGPADEWAPLQGFEPIKLSDAGRAKFLAHFGRLKELWSISGHHRILSANNFPSDCGLASSASSFAALTLATWQLAERPALTKEELSKISRTGSGSSCRSLFSPWAVWRDEGAEAIDLPLRLHHAAIIVESGKKSVSSSEAHMRVSTSRLFEGRAVRAEARLQELVEAFTSSQWRRAFEICWSEFWDMHALFETSVPAFGYMSEGSLRVLNRVREIWDKDGDGPIATMDAGANVHLLVRDDQLPRAESWLAGFRALKSWDK